MKTKQPLVSIVIPIRNGEKHIGETLRAICSQDYPLKRMEVLVVDGLSTDGTRIVVEQTASQNPNLLIKFLINQKQITPCALNIGILQSHGDFILRVDSRTQIAVDYVSACVAAHLRSGAENVGGPLTSQGLTLFGKASALATSDRFGVGNALHHYAKEDVWADTVYMGAWPRTVFEKIGLFDEEQVRNQDDEFNYRLQAAGGRILVSPLIKLMYTVRTDSPAQLWQQFYEYGFWKVRVWQKHPSQIRPRQFIPPLFVFCLFIGLIISLLYPIAWFLWLPVFSLYLILNLFSSIAIAHQTNWNVLPVLPIAFAMLHFGYGSGLLWGLIKFANHWQDRQGIIPSLPKKEAHE